MVKGLKLTPHPFISGPAHARVQSGRCCARLWGSQSEQDRAGARLPEANTLVKGRKQEAKIYPHGELQRMASAGKASGRCQERGKWGRVGRESEVRRCQA